MDKLINGFNGDIDRREQIIFGKNYDRNNNNHLNRDLKGTDIAHSNEVYDKYYVGGIKYFNNLTVNKLEELVNENFIDPNSISSDAYGCPTVAEFIKFAHKIKQLEDTDNLDITFGGYAVCPEREDYRVSIYKISFSSNNGYRINREAVQMFWDFVKTASSIECNDSNGKGIWD